MISWWTKPVRMALKIMILFLDYIIPKSRQILFSASEGLSYGDNSRYLYEYMRSNTSERLIWWFRDKRLVQWAKENGISAVFAWSIRGIWMALRSGVWVTTHSPMLPVWADNRRFLIQLWHGVGPKQVPGRMEMPRVAKSLSRYEKYDLVTIPSCAVAPEWGTIIPVRSGALVLDGYPRHDAILQADPQAARERVVEIVGRFPRWVLLYAPTWREHGMEHDLDWDGLEPLLEKHNGVLLVRSHPLYSGWLPSHKSTRVVLFNSDVMPDIYEVLAGIDVLVTDYSSLSIDYFVLKKPIVFYVPDFEQYDQIRGIHWEFPDGFPGDVATTPEELLHVLEHVLTQGELTEAGRRRQEQLFEKYFALPPGGACERLTARIVAMMDIRWPRPMSKEGTREGKLGSKVGTKLDS